MTTTVAQAITEAIANHEPDLGKHSAHYCMCGAGPFQSFNGHQKHRAAARRRSVQR